jgi:aminobenzoyl-glutamate utilization protein B
MTRFVRCRLLDPLLLSLILLAVTGFAAEPAIRDSDRAKLLAAMEAKAAHFGDVSRRIWESPEVGYKETRSAAALRDELKAAGFEVQEAVAGIPTAFVASYGSGRPVIGILAEYDALPGLSQVDAPEPRALVEGGPGHGCGHNLLGVGATFAAISVKGVMAESKLHGTIKVFGTPAEEGGAGKVYMARAGLFRDVDVALAWHPGDRNTVDLGTTLANINAKFRFHGVAAHAGARPESGRSALDALLLMAHGVELMREHVPSEARIHYVITRGGDAPNIVPAMSEIYVYARHSDMSVLDGIWSRIEKCAQAGALATETRMEIELVGSVYNVLTNDVLAAILDRNLRRVGGVKYTADEQAFAERLASTFTPSKGALEIGSQERVQPSAGGVAPSSTDLGDVSWQVPAAELTAATYVPGTPGHSWQSTACSGTSIGRKGMVVAAKTLALSALDLLTTPADIAAAQASFEKARSGLEYRSRLPADQGPPLHYRDK